MSNSAVIKKLRVPAAVDDGPQKLEQLPLKALFESPTNPRQHYNQAALDELTKSVRESGVVQPIIVRPVGAKFEIVAGHRRFRAAVAAERATIPAVIRLLTDAQVRTFQLVENLQREDVHALDEARGFRQLIDKENIDIATVADKVGVSGSYIYASLQLLKLTQKAQDAFLQDKFTRNHAVELSRLQERDQDEALKLCLDKHNPMSVRGLREWIQREIHLDLHSAPFGMEDLELVKEAGACVKCPKRTGFTPALFPDIKKKDTCTDRACFKAKVVAFVDRKRGELEAKGEKIANLDTSYHGYGDKPKAGVLSRDQWREATKANACEHTRRGIVVIGNNVGHVLSVCTKPDCKTHFSENVRRAVSPKEKAARQAEERKTRAAAMARAVGVTAAVAKVKAPALKELRVTAEAFVHEMWHEHLKAVFARRQWEPKKTSHGGKDYQAAAVAHIEEMDLREVTAFLLELALLGRYGNTDNQLGEALKRYGVDLKALERKTLVQLNEKARAKETERLSKGQKLATSVKSTKRKSH